MFFLTEDLDFNVVDIICNMRNVVEALDVRGSGLKSVGFLVCRVEVTVMEELMQLNQFLGF